MTTYFERQDQEKVEILLTKFRQMKSYGEYMRYAGNDEQYGVWLAVADSYAMRMIGVGIFDLEDYTWADSYESGESPKDALLEALENDDLYSTLLDRNE